MNPDIYIPMLALVISFIITAVSEKFTIPILHKFKFGQYIREEGPESHKKKAGTPTMGGICMMAGVLISSLIAGIISLKYGGEIYKQSLIKEMALILILTIGYTIVGFMDDYLKIKKKESEGLTVKQKFLSQTLVTGVFIALFILWGKDISRIHSACAIYIPFIKNPIVLPVVIFVIFLIIVLLGTDNGTNLTDGLDGLVSFVSIPVCICIYLMSLEPKVNFFTKYPSAVGIVAMGMLGGFLGFLIYNHYPAKVFMGDTGALAIGGFVASCACMLRAEVFIILFGFIYLMETVSVMLQVGYYKVSGGKRIFRMAPIHHHFEKGGWKETKVVVVFTVISCICCATAYILFAIF